LWFWVLSSTLLWAEHVPVGATRLVFSPRLGTSVFLIIGLYYFNVTMCGRFLILLGFVILPGGVPSKKLWCICWWWFVWAYFAAWVIAHIVAVIVKSYITIDIRLERIGFCYNLFETGFQKIENPSSIHVPLCCPEIIFCYIVHKLRC